MGLEHDKEKIIGELRRVRDKIDVSIKTIEEAETPIELIHALMDITENVKNVKFENGNI